MYRYLPVFLLLEDHSLFRKLLVVPYKIDLCDELRVAFFLCIGFEILLQNAVITLTGMSHSKEAKAI